MNKEIFMPFELVVGESGSTSKPTPVHIYLKKNGDNVELWIHNERFSSPSPFLRILPAGVVELERYSAPGNSDTFFQYDSDFCGGYFVRVTKK